MKKYIFFLKVICVISLVSACGTEDPGSKSENSTAAENKKDEPTPKAEPSQSAAGIEIYYIANKTSSALDALFGEPVKVTKITDQPNLMPGEYREYKIEEHPKGLSVRFYKDRAKRFNLLLGTPERSAEEALLKIFKIDVKELRRVSGDPLSETWKGRSGKINFETAYAKRNKSGGEFVMLHAEVSK